MSSIKQLQSILENKGGATNNSNSLQDLKTLLNTLGSVRTPTLPADTGQNRSGVTCTGHSYSDYTSGLSLKQLQDYSVNLKQLQCGSHTVTAAFCTSRTAVLDKVGCTCASRSDKYCSCAARCSCAGRTGVAGSQAECGCDGRTIFCSCETRTCSHDYVCACNTRSDDVGCTCVTRTSVPPCGCNTRCSCNTETQYA